MEKLNKKFNDGISSYSNIKSDYISKIEMLKEEEKALKQQLDQNAISERQKPSSRMGSSAGFHDKEFQTPNISRTSYGFNTTTKKAPPKQDKVDDVDFERDLKSDPYEMTDKQTDKAPTTPLAKKNQDLGTTI